LQLKTLFNEQSVAQESGAASTTPHSFSSNSAEVFKAQDPSKLSALYLEAASTGSFLQMSTSRSLGLPCALPLQLSPTSPFRSFAL